MVHLLTNDSSVIAKSILEVGYAVVPTCEVCIYISVSLLDYLIKSFYIAI